MESSSIATYTPRTSKKRVFPGSSSSCAEPDVIEITPPLTDQSSKSKARVVQKEVVFHEIIDVDMDDDCDDVLFIGEKGESNKKMKGISLGSCSASKLDAKKVESNTKGKEVPNSSKSFNPNSNNYFDLDNYVFGDDYLRLQSDFDNIDLPTGIEAPVPWLQSHFDNIDLPTGMEAPVPWLQDSVQMKKMTTGNPFVISNAVLEASGSQPNRIGELSTSTWHPSSNNVLAQNMYSNHTQTGNSNYLSNNYNAKVAVNSPNTSSSRLAGSSSRMAKPVNDEVMKMLQSFKKFDTVMDHSDHHFATTQPPKRCAKKIQEEWRILEKDLPDTIFVRVYESRMDLLRAVIIGAEGTPYHDGLFFFDVCFPSTYPKKPPLVHYHSGGLRINPNLYNCGKVCLSLLNTWSGGQKEKWIPGTSTMLQVLVSIQGLILNMKPYFNEPGYARSSGSVHGEKSSLHYNENTLILSLKTMVYTMNRPPKNFEDLVVGHFRSRVVDILMACKAYTEGVQVGCLVKGGVQDVDEDNNRCSQQFKNDVASYSKTLIAAFKKIGATEAEEFLHPLDAKWHSQL